MLTIFQMLNLLRYSNDVSVISTFRSYAQSILIACLQRMAFCRNYDRHSLWITQRSMRCQYLIICSQGLRATKYRIFYKQIT